MADGSPGVGEAWKLAPRSITTYAYASLVLFFVASIFESSRSGNTISYVISVCLAFGFMLALVGFGRIAKNDGEFYKYFGNTMIAVAVFAILSLFISVITYAEFGRPIWMDHWFQPNLKVEKPTGVQVHTGSANRVLNPHWLSWEARADEKENNDKAHSLTVEWSVSLPNNTIVSVSYKKHGDQIYSSEAEVKGDVGFERIVGLDAGCVYDIRLYNIIDGRHSEAFVEQGATDAVDLILQGDFNGYSAFYTGPLKREGKDFQASAMASKIVFRPQKTLLDPVWIWSGGAHDGKPNGEGKLETDPIECRSSQCGSVCRGTASDGAATEFRCDLHLAAYNVTYRGQTILYDGPSSYNGNTTQAIKAPFVRVGPFLICFEGSGALQANDREYQDQYDGIWHSGEFVQGRIRKSSNGPNEMGVLLSGQEYTKLGCCLLRMTPYNESSQMGGTASQTSPNTIEIGGYNGAAIYNGFEINSLFESVPYHKNYFLSFFYTDSGIKKRYQNTSPESAECLQSENFGLEQKLSIDWRVSCSFDDGPRASCEMKSAKTDIVVNLSLPGNTFPQTFIRTSTSARGGRTNISIGSKELNIAEDRKQDPIQNLELLAEMCAGNSADLTNKDLRQSVSLTSFCPTLAIAYARILSCTK